MIKRAIIAINKTVNIITQYNTSHYTASREEEGIYLFVPSFMTRKTYSKEGSISAILAAQRFMQVYRL